MSAERAASTLCRGCGERIFFVQTVNGKHLPVNLEPDPAGNCAVYRDAAGHFLGRTLSKAHPDPSRVETVYMPHMATCGKLRKASTRPPAARPSNVIPISRGREVELPI